MGRMDLPQHAIHIGDRPSIRQQDRRLLHSLKGAVKDQLQEMLEEDVIRPSASLCSSPGVLVKKEDGRFRFCFDNRQLVAVTTKDSYTLPRIN